METTTDRKETPATASIEYVGPPGQESPLVGPLVAGRRYQMDAAMAAYLCDTHPMYWRRPAPQASPAPVKE